jgi:D-alanyl-D-alanine carboxypeptidase (penicillin-binding protein 5/6)
MSLGRWLSTLFAILVMAFLPIAIQAQEVPELKINSTRYVVVDSATGNIFAQRDANERVAIASLTKVFTAVQAIEMASPETIITTSDFDLRTPDGGYFGSNGTLMGFDAGEEYTLEDMLYGMLLPSGNDAANAIARNLGYRDGDSDKEAVQHFMDLLNQRISDMGLKNTHLMNPHGWGVDDHYSSAADVAAFYRLASRYPLLVEIMGTHSYTTGDGAITVTNTNKSLKMFDSVIAGKTGYDWDSGYCLVNIARRGDVEMIAVTLDGVAPDDWYDDNATLLEYGFEQADVLTKSGKPFDGDVAKYIDPSSAEIARSSESSSAWSTSGNAPESAPTQASTSVADAPDPVLANEQTVETNPRDAGSIANTSAWGVVAAVSVILVRGALSFTSIPFGRRSRQAGTSANSGPALTDEIAPA